MKRLVLISFLTVIACLSSGAQHLKVASYNVRYQNKGDDDKGQSWVERCPVICKQLMFHDPDIIGAQEVLKAQLDDMSGLLPGYSCVGVGREDGGEKGEFAPIFYRTDRFYHVSSGTFWLSETPDIPRAGWDAKYTRICTWAQLKDKVSGRKIWFFNTHFDHVGTQARIESARLITSRIREMAGGEDAILTGDFNVDQNSPSYQELVRDGFLTDSFEAAPIKLAHNGTVAGGFRINRWTSSRIDHILVTEGLSPLRYGVLTDLYWTAPDEPSQGASPHENTPGEVMYHDKRARIPSDHFLVLVQLTLEEQNDGDTE